jgi:xylulokinase
VIGASRDHRRAGGKPCLRRGLGGDLAHDLVGGADRRQESGGDAGLGQERWREFAPADIHEPRFQRPVVIDAPRSGEAVGDVVIGAEDRGDAGEDIRLMALQPAQLGCHDLLIDAAAGGGEEGGGIDRPVTDPRLFIDYHIIPGLYFSNGCTATSGSLLNWIVRELAGGEQEAAAAAGLKIHAWLDRLASEVPAGAEGLVLLPYFLGEKTPLQDPMRAAP